MDQRRSLYERELSITDRFVSGFEQLSGDDRQRVLVAALDAVAVPLFLVEPATRRILHANAAAWALVAPADGAPPELLDAVRGDGGPDTWASEIATALEGKSFTCEAALRLPAGGEAVVRWTVSPAVGVDPPVVIAVAELEEEANRDPLTGLPNRRLFLRRLDRAFERQRRRDDYGFAVCYIDLDHFKPWNDSQGHLAGDRLLIEAARRLTGCVRPGDMAARLGGDEFAVLLDDLQSPMDAQCVADRIRRQLLWEAPTGQPVSASVGVAMSREAVDPSALLDKADRAMYADKAAKRSPRRRPR